jgi:hypothetical protein
MEIAENKKHYEKEIIKIQIQIYYETKSFFMETVWIE